MEILIAEDDEQIALSLKKNFSEEGHHVMIAKDGEETSRMASSILFDIILLDWRMPKKTGIEVCKELRESGNEVPIILLTALSQVSNKVEALKLGADDYVTKPFSFEELAARIDAVLRRYKLNTDVLTFDNLSLNLIDRKVHFKDEEIILTVKEFELLRFFVLNKDSVASKEDILKQVWNLNYDPGSHLVEVTVKNLRKKCEEITGKNFIKSIYGEGYILLAE
ncbi:MAG: response regulator transcription factor [Ignavibacteriaceae bacterium]